MRPFEFIIPQRPVSQQARRQHRLRAWIQFVAQCARAASTEQRALEVGPVSLRLLYFYDVIPLDVDNILKPIQDALVGILYADDQVVTDVEIRRRWLGTAFTLSTVTPMLASGLASGSEFVYVAASDAPAQDVL